MRTTCPNYPSPELESFLHPTKQPPAEHLSTEKPVVSKRIKNRSMEENNETMQAATEDRETAEDGLSTGNTADLVSDPKEDTTITMAQAKMNIEDMDDDPVNDSGALDVKGAHEWSPDNGDTPVQPADRETTERKKCRRECPNCGDDQQLSC